MATSNWDPESHDDDEAIPQKDPPNSWTVNQILEPRCAALLISTPNPIVPFSLNLNDKRFLRSIKVDPDK